MLTAETRVLELGASIAAATCGRFLRHLGAEVITIEPPGGSALRDSPPFLPGVDQPRRSALFAALAAGKEHRRLATETDHGRAAVEELVRGADVVLMSGRLHEWASVGLSPARLTVIAPQLVIGRVTMFGDAGPYADLAGGEVQALALGGLMNLIGLPEREPLRLGGVQAQSAAGLAMLTGVLTGLFARAAGGGGSEFVTSVLETVAHLEWKGAVSAGGSGSSTERGPDAGPMIVPCSDGFFALFYRPDDWPKVKAALDDPRLDDPRFETHTSREAHRDALVEVVSDVTSPLTKRDLYHLTQRFGVPTGYVASIGDLLASPQYHARGFLTEVDLDTGGHGVLPGQPWRTTEASGSGGAGART